MKRRFISAGCAVGALLAATAAPAYAAGVTLTGTAGIGGLSLPDDGGSIVGPYLGVDGVIDIGPVAGYEGLIGVSLWTQVGRSNSSADSLALDGSDTLLFVPGSSIPPGTIDLNANTSGGLNAESDIDADPGAQDATLSGGSGVNDGWGVVGDDDGFIYGGIFANSSPTPRSAAFGAIATPDGAVFVAGGDLDGLTVTRETSRDVTYAGGNVTFGLGTVKDGGLVISAYSGPAFRLLNQDIRSELTIDIPGMADDEFPQFSISRDETLDSTYFGGVVGFTMSKQVASGLILSLGGEAGAYAMQTSYDGSERYGVSGGSTGSGGVSGIATPSVSVDNTVQGPDGPSLDESGTAYSVGLNGALTLPMSQQTQLSLGLGADYLSRVATVERPDLDSFVDPSPLPTSSAPILSYGDAWSWRVTASVTGQF